VNDRRVSHIEEDTGMHTAVGVFSDRRAAEHAVGRLRNLGFPADRITLLTPGESAEAMPSKATATEAMPTTEGEAPGVGTAMGAVVGGAVGAAAGLPLGAAIGALIPGVGPVIAIGIAGAAILGATGAKVGGAIEMSLTEGVPRDEAVVYADALRQGRSIVIALAEDTTQAEAARSALGEARAETLDAARDRWWLGLRSAEREHYVAAGRDFAADEPAYRQGFEAGLRLAERGSSYGEAQGALRELYPAVYDTEPFRRGYERGVAHELGRRDLRHRAA
jgi:hypothetical protein